MSRQVVIIKGDGVGEEVVAAARRILTKAADMYRLNISYEEHLAGGAAIDRCGTPLPQATIDAAKQSAAVLLGAVGGPKWDNVPPAIRAEKAILGLRQELGLYANLRPVRITPSLIRHSPLKPEYIAGADILIMRELNGGVYYGDRQEADASTGRDTAWDREVYSKNEVARIVKMACEAARKRRGKVVSVDKANVLATSRLWRKTAEETAAAYPDVALSHMYVDNCAMQLVLGPKNFDVIVTSNLFGDILSDEAAVLAGSIGMLPSASLGSGPGLYEPIHGSAPDIAGKGVANPLGTILSAAMLLRYSLDCAPAADAVEAAVEQALADGYRTADLYQPGLTKVSTEEMANIVEARIQG
ncbi:MAG: 3-isopropylmalate dehydrogenase [Negativicutes bacterium]|nr:3-isopropylmalate dehydrogenase [Negativicutes bacterium]